jgi:preprotein translocase subunit YajC
MNLLISDANAQAVGAAAPTSGFGIQNMLLLAVMMVVFYFLLIRPQQKRAKEHAALLSKLATGDEVVTTGGILGRVTEVGETFVTLEIADGVRIKLQRAQVSQLVPKGTYKSA